MIPSEFNQLQIMEDYENGVFKFKKGFPRNIFIVL